MNKEIICVYQDCPLCGDRGKKLKKIIIAKNLNVRKVSFASDEGRHLIHEAVFKHKMGSLPFFTDGERFSYSIVELTQPKAEKVEEKPKAKRTRRTRKSKKVEVEDESSK